MFFLSFFILNSPILSAAVLVDLGVYVDSSAAIFVDLRSASGVMNHGILIDYVMLVVKRYKIVKLYKETRSNKVYQKPL